MKPQRDFVAERAAAQHCAELLRRGPEPAELLPLFAKAGERFARQLAQGLLAVAGGEAPAVECQPVRETTMADLAGTIAPLAANALLGAGIGAAPLLASLQAEAVLRLVDKAFGGKGEAPAVLPEKFPLSARLLIERLEAMVAQRLGQALGSADAIRALRRDGSLADLAPFAPETRLAVLDLDVMEGMRGPWRLTLALPYATLAELFGHGERVPAARPRAPASPIRPRPPLPTWRCRFPRCWSTWPCRCTPSPRSSRARCCRWRWRGRSRLPLPGRSSPAAPWARRMTASPSSSP